MTRKTVYLSHDLMKEMCHRLAVTFFAHYQEPIPPFDDHDKHLLESAVNLPKATYGRQELYPTISAKAAVLFYSLIKNHPFKNGNKRIGTAALLVFLYLNGYWVLDTNRSIYKKAIRVAKSNPEERDQMIKELETWLRNHLTRVRKLRKRDIPLLVLDRTLDFLTRWLPRFWQSRKMKKIKQVKQKNRFKKNKKKNN